MGDGWCANDPAACPDGFSISMWVNIIDNGASVSSGDGSGPPPPPERVYLLSTGEQDDDSVGISLYLYEGKLGVAVSDGLDYWKIIQDEEFPLGKISISFW